VGWQLGAPILFTSTKFLGSRTSRPSRLLISNPLDSRVPLVPALTERVSRPLVSNRTLRGSGFFKPWARAVRGSRLLGKGPGH
jgi:hypothetical protein